MRWIKKPTLLSVLISLLAAVISSQPAVAAEAPARDPEGVIYYVMTEDNEITVRWKKCIGPDPLLTRHAFEVMMIEKVDRINAIAEKYGARWTHFTAVGTWYLAKEAASKSSNWQGMQDALKQQVVRGSQAGHEYAPHPHAIWDPRTAFNTLAWNEERDGFDDAGGEYASWTTAFLKLGSYDEINSALGYLYNLKRELALVTGKESLVERTGGWQFGSSIGLQTISLRALAANNILANSDANRNLSESGPLGLPYGKNTYFTAPRTINIPTNGSAFGTMEFTPSPNPPLVYDSDSLSKLNAKVDEAVRAFTDSQGRVKPGVHIIVGFTHAKALIGSGGWSSTIGGDFTELDRHLAYVKQNYGSSPKPLIHFATASEAVKAYYAANAPRPVAVLADNAKHSEPGALEYSVVVLGRERFVGEEATVKPPIEWDARQNIAEVRLMAAEKPLATFDTFASPYPDLPFIVPDTNDIVMQVVLKEQAEK